MENIVLPQELSSSIGSESKDFAVKAGRAYPLKESVKLLIAGIVWTAFTSPFIFLFFGPLFLGEEVHFEADGVPVVASPDNLGPIMIPAIIMGIFILVGIGLLSWGIYSLFKKGGYFAGTPTRLVHFQDGNVRSIDWEQFSGDIEVSGNAQKGNISLQLRTGQMVKKGDGPERYVPDVLYISGISNAFEVEQICRRRIKENDPTPTTIS